MNSKMERARRGHRSTEIRQMIRESRVKIRAFMKSRRGLLPKEKCCR